MPHTAKPHFDARAFQLSDGALMMIKDDDRAEPYFATKALLTAHELGLEISAVAEDWIEWMLPRQDPQNGNFLRYTRIADTPLTYDGGEQADADDSLLALWIELLYTLAPDTGMKPLRQQSIDRAYDCFVRTFTSNDVCHAFEDYPFGYLMDNAEVYQSLLRTAWQQRRLGQNQRATECEDRAARQYAAIPGVFWDQAQHQFQWATEWEQPMGKDEPGLIYPRGTAQVFPLLDGITTPAGTDASVFSEWLKKHGHTWLTPPEGQTVWGLVALAAWKVGDLNTVLTWMALGDGGERLGPKWTNLDEAIYQGLDPKLPAGNRTPAYDPRLGIHV